jgi:acetyl-CoA acetyltransferase
MDKQHGGGVMDIRGKVAIVGVGNTAYGRLPGRSALSLAVEAIKNALDDCGLSPKEVDAVLTKAPTSTFPMMWSTTVAQAIGVMPRVTATLDQGGASNISLIGYAAWAIATGQCSVAVISYADNPATGARAAYSRPRGEAAAYGAFGVIPWYAMIAQRHMHEFGTKPEHLAAVAMTCRKHASLNPNAQIREPLTLEGYFSSRFVCEPLRLPDCCPITDGGAAVVVTSADRARDLRKPPVYVLGIGQAHVAWEVPYRPNLTTSAAAISGPAAFRMAGIGPEDVDLVQLYDCFSIVPIITLEDYGFCPKGEGGAFVSEGRVALGGQLPMNTSGGLLAETGMPGMQLIVEAVRQLRGEAGDRQVPNARICVVSGQGGVMTTHATLVLGKEAA